MAALSKTDVASSLKFRCSKRSYTREIGVRLTILRCGIFGMKVDVETIPTFEYIKN
jgi:hypothetical protein